MSFFYNIILVLSIGVIFLIIGKFIKVRFIELIGFIVCILAVFIPVISFLLGFIDAFK